MSHAHHFLSRLDRVSLPHAELALGLYNDVPLLLFILGSVRLPEAATRVAISLAHPTNGPFLVVTREGRFVTCLGEGMSPGEHPVVTRGQLDALAAKVGVLRARMADAERMAGAKGGVGKLLRRIHDAGEDLSREEILAISGLQPLYAFEFFQCLFAAAGDLKDTRDRLLRELRRTDRLKPQFTPLLRSYWNTFWSLGHFSVLATMDGLAPLLRASDAMVKLGENFPLSWVTVREGITSLALKGAWAVGRIGKPQLAGAKQRYRDANTQLSILDGCLSLGAIALRHTKLSAEISKLMATGPDVGPEQVYGNFVQKVNSIAHRMISDDSLKPEDFIVSQGMLGGNAWMEMTKHLPSGAPYRFDRYEDVPQELAMCAAVNIPLDFMGDVRVAFNMFVALPWVARAAPEQLYLPHAAIQAKALPWKVEDTMSLLRSHEKNPIRLVHTLPVRSSGPPRQEPCPCGSGKKYKRCCEEAKPA